MFVLSFEQIFNDNKDEYFVAKTEIPIIAVDSICESPSGSARFNREILLIYTNTSYHFAIKETLKYRLSKFIEVGRVDKS